MQRRGRIDVAAALTAALPDDFDWVEGELFVVAEDGEGFRDGLGDEQAVEGVAVVDGEGFELEDVLVADGEELHAVILHLVAQVTTRNMAMPQTTKMKSLKI